MKINQVFSAVTMSEKTEVIRLEGISKQIGGKEILNRIDLCIYSHQILGIAGEGASGKSALCNILTGKALADSGKIVFTKNKDCINENGKEIRIAYINAESRVIDKLPLAENIFLGDIERFRRFFVIDRDKLISESHTWLRRVGLNNKSPVQDAYILNTGEKKLLELARAIKDEPRILILDDVFLVLERGMRERFIRLIQNTEIMEWQ